MLHYILREKGPFAYDSINYMFSNESQIYFLAIRYKLTAGS